jgi:hypothetical protein
VPEKDLFAAVADLAPREPARTAAELRALLRRWIAPALSLNQA